MSNSAGSKQEWSGTRYPVICKYFKSGTCKLGDSCRFSHSYGNSSTSGGNNTSTGVNSKSTSNSIRTATTEDNNNSNKVSNKKVYNSQDGGILHSPTLGSNNSNSNNSTPISYVNATTINNISPTLSSVSNNNSTTGGSNTVTINTSSSSVNNSNSNSSNNLNSSMNNLSLDDNEEFISYHTRSNPSRMAGRRPFLQLVVLYAADPRVLRFSKEVQSMFLERGIDVFLKTEENNQSIKTENLAEIITGSKADCLIVLGDRNLKNRSCQAKRRGKLVEMDIEEAINCIWNEWSLLLPKEDEELTDEQVFNLLEKHCRLRHVKDRLSKFKTSINEFKEIKLPSKNSRTIDPNPTFLDEKIASKLTSAQKSVMRFHLQVVEAIEYVEDMPFITQTEKLTSTRGSIVGPEVSTPDSKPVISESNREKLLYHLSLILVKIEKLGHVLSEFGSPLWDAYYEEYREKQSNNSNDNSNISNTIASSTISSSSSTSTSTTTASTAVSNSNGNSNNMNGNNSSNNSSNNTNGNGYHYEDEPVVDMKPGQWRCNLCTYINDPDTYSCSMCLTPQSSTNGDHDNHGWNNNSSSGNNKGGKNNNQKKLSVQTSYVKVDDKSKKDSKLSIQTDQPKLSVITTTPTQTTTPTPTTTVTTTTTVTESITTTTTPTNTSTSIDSPSTTTVTTTNPTNLNSSLPSIPTTITTTTSQPNTLSSSQPISFSTILSKDPYSSLYTNNNGGVESTTTTTVPPEHYEEDFPALSEKVSSKSKNPKVTKTGGIQSPSSPTSSTNSLQPPLSPSINNNPTITNSLGIQSPTKLKQQQQQQTSFNLPINNNNNNNNTINSFPQSPNGKLFGAFESSSDVINSPRGLPSSATASNFASVNAASANNGTKGPNYYNIFANNTWESSIFSKDSSSATTTPNGSSYIDPLFSWSSFNNNNNNNNSLNSLENNNNNNNNNNVNSKQSSFSSNGVNGGSSLFDLNIFQQSPFSSVGGSSSSSASSSSIFNSQPNSASTSSSASTISSTAFPSMYSQYSNSNSLSSLQQQYQQQFFNQQPFLNSTRSTTTTTTSPSPSSSSSISPPPSSNSNSNLNNTISNNNNNNNSISTTSNSSSTTSSATTINSPPYNVQQQIQLQLFIQQQQNQQTQQHQQEQFEREKQRAREIVNEKYKHSQPPQRPCCYCGEESMLECYNCAKTGYATYFCSKEHQSLMWKEHMRVHQFYANNFQQPQQPQQYMNK